MTPLSSHSTVFPGGTVGGFVKNWHVGRRSASVYVGYHYGLFGLDVLSNPANPGIHRLPMSFRDNGPVGGGTGRDCWPGPLDYSICDSATGPTRAGVIWTLGCGTGFQVEKLTANGGGSYGQQVDIESQPATVATAFTNGGSKDIAYFTVSGQMKMVDMTTVTGRATPPFLPISTAVPTAPLSMYAFGGLSTDRFLLIVATRAANTQRVLSIMAVNPDGTLTPTTGTCIVNASGTASVSTFYDGPNYTIACALSDGIHLFNWDKTTLSEDLPMIRNPLGSKYTKVLYPCFSSRLLMAGRADGKIDLYPAGGRQISGTIPAAANGFGVDFAGYVAKGDTSKLYTYRATSVDANFSALSESWAI